MEKMPISGNMAPPCLVLDDLLALLLSWLDGELEEMLTVGRHRGGLPRHGHRGTREGCQVGARHFASFWCLQAGRLTHAGTLGRTCARGQAQVSSLLLLLLCSPVKAAVVRKFLEISCSGFGRGGEMAGLRDGARDGNCKRCDARLTVKRELLLREDSWMVHRAGRVPRRCGQCFPVKGYERFASVLATAVRLILKLDIYPEVQWANAPYGHSLVVEPPEVCSPPCLRALSQKKIHSLVELPVSLHCLEKRPLRCHKSQMPNFQGWIRCVWSAESEGC